MGWLLGVGGAFYVFLALYSALLSPDGDQDVLETLGTGEGFGFLLLSAVLVVVLAPFAEELLFRGFMYRCLRNRLKPVAAALVTGAIFGSIHYSGPETLELIPLLAVLGVAFCVLYERTASLYPAIALHAINNAVAFALTAGTDAAPPVAGAALAVTLVLCLVVPNRQAAATRAA